MPTLFELTGELAEIETILACYDGEFTDDEKDAQLHEFFEHAIETNDQFEEKIDAYVHLIAEFEARAEYRNKEAERLRMLALRDDAESTRLRQRLQDALKMLGKKDFQTRLHKFKFKTAGGIQALRLTVDENEDVLNNLSPAFIETVPAKTIPAFRRIDKQAVRAALEQGKELGFAELLPRKETLKIT